MNIISLLTNYHGKVIPKELNEFNWGAFLLTFIWGTKYKAWITFLAVPLVFIQLPLGINWILLIAFQFYCGINGNKWAYQSDWWKKPADFRLSQTKWAIFAVGANIIIPFMILTILASFISKNSENPKLFIENALCTITYNKLKNGLKDTHITQYSDSADIAKQFGKNFSNTKTMGNTVVFSIDSKHVKKEAYTITFLKSDLQACSLYEKNCLVEASYIISTEMPGMGSCYYHIDQAKHIVPSSETKKALQKGINIFNYL